MNSPLNYNFRVTLSIAQAFLGFIFGRYLLGLTFWTSQVATALKEINFRTRYETTTYILVSDVCEIQSETCVEIVVAFKRWLVSSPELRTSL